MGLLRTILILFIIFYVIRLVTRFFLPMLFKNYVDDKMNEMAGNQKKQQQRQKEQARKREGEVSIDYNPRQGSSKDKNDKGDYVDYVEVKD
jgi:sortase (surface protein transpeptidase)